MPGIAERNRAAVILLITKRLEGKSRPIGRVRVKLNSVGPLLILITKKGIFRMADRAHWITGTTLMIIRLVQAMCKDFNT